MPELIYLLRHNYLKKYYYQVGRTTFTKLESLKRNAKNHILYEHPCINSKIEKNIIEIFNNKYDKYDNYYLGDSKMMIKDIELLIKSLIEENETITSNYTDDDVLRFISENLIHTKSNKDYLTLTELKKSYQSSQFYNPSLLNNFRSILENDLGINIIQKGKVIKNKNGIDVLCNVTNVIYGYKFN